MPETIYTVESCICLHHVQTINLVVTNIIHVNPMIVRLALHVAQREKCNTKFSSQALMKTQHLDKISVDARNFSGTIGTGRA